MIEIKHLKLIQAVAELGTLKKAAEKLNLSQSALSHQLKELEGNLGALVFHRINNQLLFTPLGKELLERSLEILKQCNSLESRVQEFKLHEINRYTHGYSQEETNRLNDQANSIAELLHWDSIWPTGSLVLEAGCGVGAQTRIIAPKNPGSSFISIDLSEKSLHAARAVVEQEQIKNVTLEKADVFNLPYNTDSFDHIFVCFVLEHLSKPELALAELKRVLKPQGTITIIEGDHGSTYFFPDSLAAQRAVQAQVTVQAQNGGNANIGREVSILLRNAGFKSLVSDPRVVFVDDSKPSMVDGFVKNTFTAMIKGIAEEAVSRGVVTQDEMDTGIRDLLRTAEGGGSFSYTFFKVVGTKDE